MTGGLGFSAFDQEFADFSKRVAALRGVRDGSPDIVDALLLELDLAQEELRVIHDELTEQDTTRHSDTADRERALLRTVFGDLPVPVFVLDHGGFIRRANAAAAELLGTSSAYTAGKPFPAFVDLSARAAFRSQLSALLRGGGTAEFSSVVLASRRRLRTRIVLARLDPPSEVRPLVAAVVLPPPPEPERARPADAGAVPAARRPNAGKAAPAGYGTAGYGPLAGAAGDEDTPAAAARRVDLLSQVTRLLLDEQSLNEPATLHRIAWMLQARTAEWVIIDLVRDGELSRAVVAGPDVAPDQMIAGDKAPPAPLHGQVLETGKTAVHPFILDENALGITRSGQPVLTVLGAGSLLSVPLHAAGITAGVLTLVRPPEQAAFDLSDLRILEEIGELLALALRNERRYQHRTETVSALPASLLPQAPVRLPGVTWAGAYRPGTLGAEAGGDFYDLFTSGSGCGLALGDVSGKGEEAAAVTAMARHGIRLLSLWDDQPAHVLAKVNTALATQQETDRFVTVLAAHLRWRGDDLEVDLASAGHPGAAVIRASGAVSFTPGGGLPLGLFDTEVTQTERLLLRAGDSLVLFSDGVTERRAADGSRYGTTRLAEALTRSLGQPPAGMIRAIEDDLAGFSRSTQNRDDVAILALRAENPPG